jgi:glycine/D-amino acid oxidase-like deaminating enzyme
LAEQLLFLFLLTVKLRSGEPYWLLRNGIINSYPSLWKDLSCDVLVVGGGISGALMAYQFSMEGYKTIVIERRDIGMGSTCANTAILQYEIDEPLYSLRDIVGEEAAKGTYIQGVKAIHKMHDIVRLLPVDCGFEYRRSLHVAYSAPDADGLKRELDCRKELGIKVKWVTKSDLLSQFGVVGEGAILSDVAASVDVYQLTHVLLKYSEKKFALQIYDHTSLEKVEYEKSCSRVLVNTGASILAKHIVYATGYESHDFIIKNIGKLSSTYACISEPFNVLPSSLQRMVFWDTEDPYFYCRSTFDNRILIGGEDEPFVNPEKRDSLIEEKESDLVEKFQQFLPGIKFIPDFSWAGTFGVTKDALPFIGAHPDYPHSFFVLGFGGNGTTFSIMGMEVLSDAIVGRPNKFLEYFKFNR